MMHLYHPKEHILCETLVNNYGNDWPGLLFGIFRQISLSLIMGQTVVLKIVFR